MLTIIPKDQLLDFCAKNVFAQYYEDYADIFEAARKNDNCTFYSDTRHKSLVIVYSCNLNVKNESNATVVGFYFLLGLNSVVHRSIALKDINGNIIPSIPEIIQPHFGSLYSIITEAYSDLNGCPVCNKINSSFIGKTFYYGCKNCQDNFTNAQIKHTIYDKIKDIL